MSKTPKFSIKDNEEVVSKPQVEAQQESVPDNGASLIRWMVGTYLDPVTREWMLAQIKFDPVTFKVGEIETERVSGDFYILRERLQIKQIRLGLLEEENQ